MAGARDSGARNDRSSTRRIGLALRDGLSRGAWFTYAELAALAGCDERTVRNHLRAGEGGLEVERTRGSDGRVRVRAPQGQERATIEHIALGLARDLLRRVFPIAGTDLDHRADGHRHAVAWAVPGAREYGEKHLRIVRAWIQASTAEPRVALQINYTNLAEVPGPRRVWPVGVILREAARVYLVGCPAGSRTASDIRTYALERVDAGPLLRLGRAEAGVPPRGLEQMTANDAVDLPFSIFRPSRADAVKARLRFSSDLAGQVEGRRWHRSQRLRRNADGTLTLEFGPSEVGEVVHWILQWGDGVTVLGDKRLLAAMSSR